MANFFLTVAIVVFSLLLVAAILIVTVPYYILQKKRRASWDHIPQPEEIWVQDNGMLYIDAVTDYGVELMSVVPNPQGGAPVISKWKDSWEDWHKRLRTNTIFFTGQKRPLGPVV